MCEEQKKILQDYKKKFPKDSFQKVSLRTGIQTTRIFRIFKGSSMKLDEFLIFQRLLQESDEKNLYDLCQKNLRSHELSFLQKQMLYLLEKNRFQGGLL